jgi:hypothetical protein
MLWIFLGSLFVSAIIRAVIRRQREIASRPPLDDPRWSGETRKQIAGRKCIECGQKVILANEGEACETCGEVAHVKSCLVQHERSAHRLETNVPYR